MKSFFWIIVVLVLQSACRQKDTGTTVAVLDTIPTPQAPEVISEEPATTPPVHNYDTLPAKVIGNMIMKGKLPAGDNTYTFRLMDSLQSANKADRLFYFKVFNKIMNRADGALGDAIGKYALSYVEQYPAEFIDYIQTLPAERFETWAGHIGIEIFLSAMDARQGFQKFKTLVLENCKGCSKSTRLKLQQFNNLVWSTLQENVQDQPNG